MSGDGMRFLQGWVGWLKFLSPCRFL